MFFCFKRVLTCLHFLYSNQSKNIGKYDDRDLLIGHGTDNLPVMRLCFTLAIVDLVFIALVFYNHLSFSAFFSFLVVFIVINYYVNHLPQTSVLTPLNQSFSSLNKAYRSYLGGRILCTPHGVILSYKCKKVRTQPDGNGTNTAQSQANLNINNDQQHNKQSKQNQYRDQSEYSKQRAQSEPSEHSTQCKYGAQSQYSEQSTKSNNQQSTQSAPSANLNDNTAQRSSTAFSKDSAQEQKTNQDQDCATKEEVTPAREHSLVSLSKPTKFLTKVLSYKNKDKSKAEYYLKPLVPVNCDPNAYAKIVDLSLAAANSNQDNLPVQNIGFMTKVNPPLMAGLKIHAAMPLSLDALNQLTYYMLKPLMAEAKRKLQPSDLCFLGFGFEWLPKHTRRLHQVMDIGVRSSVFGKKGSPDIHAVEDVKAFDPIYFSADLLVGHTMLLGTTGAGKTRFFDLLVSQAIMRGDTVVVLDPKGDRSLQQCILRAARQANREPYEDIYCLDIGRGMSPSLSSQETQDFAQISEGQLHPFGAHDLPLGASFSRRQRHLNESYGQNSVIRHGHFSLNDEQAINQTPASLRAQSLGYPNPIYGSDLTADPDHKDNADQTFFDHMNTGFNPTSAFDRSTEIGDRITAMMPKSGTAASFQAYSNVAIAAAVECLMLTGQKVSLEHIRSILIDHDSYSTALRTFLNRTVVELNCAEASLYFNNLHGIKNTHLKTNCYAVTVLLGESASGSVSVNKEEKALSLLDKMGLLSKEQTDPSALDLPPSISDSTDEESEESTNTSTTPTRGRPKKTTTAKKTTRGPHTASIKELYHFYKWLIKKGLVQPNSGVDKIFGIATLSPDYFKKVTNGILPYLSALTAGDLVDLLSNDEEMLPTFLDMIRNNKIFYAALHCLKDSSTGQALGKLLMSDLAFVAGEINAKGLSHYKRVSVFIDEASELSNESLVQLLNKSRSSNFAITLATQCVSDLALRSGSMEAANQIIANCNNLISLRVNDPLSASVIASVLPHTVVTDRSSTISFSDNAGNGADSYSSSRTLSQHECELFPNSMLMQLPDLEFIARLANGCFYKGLIPMLLQNKGKVKHSTSSLKHQGKAIATQVTPVPHNPNPAQANLEHNFQEIESDLQVMQADSSLREQIEAWQKKVASDGDEQELFLNSILVDAGFNVCRSHLGKNLVYSQSEPMTEEPKSVCKNMSQATKPEQESSTIDPLNPNFDYSKSQTKIDSKQEQTQKSSQSRQESKSLDILSWCSQNTQNKSQNKLPKTQLRYNHDNTSQAGSVNNISNIHKSSSYSNEVVDQCNQINQDRLIFLDFDDQDYINGNFAKAGKKQQDNKINQDYQDYLDSQQRVHNKSLGYDKNLAQASLALNLTDSPYQSLKYSAYVISKALKWLKTLVFSWVLSLCQFILHLILNVRALVFYHICLDCALFLAMVAFVAVLFKENVIFTFYSSWSNFITDLSLLLKFSAELIVNPNVYVDSTLLSQMSFLQRLSLVISLYIRHYDLIAMAIGCGLLLGNRYILMCEIQHISVLGLRKFTNIFTLPSICLFLLCIYLLATSFIFCIEFAQIVLGFYIFMIAFKCACFYTQHVK